MIGGARIASALLALSLLGCAAGPPAPAAGDGEPADPGLDAGALDRGTVLAPDAGAPADAAALDALPDASAVAADAGVATPSMRLTVQGDRLLLPDGSPLEFSGAISCCGGGYGWPLYDQAWLDLAASHGVRFLHLRLGPFLTGEGGEPDWAPIGGGYVEAGGRADLSQLNAPFWQHLQALIGAAQARGIWVEVDIIDGWAIRHCRRGDIPGYSAWAAANNLQGEDLCAAAGSEAIAPGSRYEAWVQQVVQATGAFDNVTYQDGNEVGLINGYDPAWSESIAAIIRAEERRLDFPRHLYATNSGDPRTIDSAAIDLVELHTQDAPDAAQCRGKPCLVNEYNPDPPLSPEALHARYCEARRANIYFWYWRHGQDAVEMERSLALIAAGCP